MSEQSYAGDVSPHEAYTAVSAGRSGPDGPPRALLVDVRTRAEWTFVGVPVLEDAEPLFVEWSTWPDGAANPQFVDQVRAAGVRDGQPIYLLCRSGVRSVAAAKALTAAGLGPAYNILEGFEGPHDTSGHRAVAGWKHSGLPWQQG